MTAAAEAIRMERRPNAVTAWSGALTVVDQALFAGASFAVSVLLARWLSVHAYGAFSLAFLVFLLVGAVHTSLLGEPMMIFGAGRFRDDFRRYAGATIIGHVLVSIPIAAAMLMTAGLLDALGSRTSAVTFLWLAAAAPCMLLLWLVRRAFYVTMEIGRAAAGDALYLGLTLAGLWILSKTSTFGPGPAIGVMGAISLVASCVLLAQLRPSFRTPAGAGFRELARSHWAYGRWNIAGQGFFWASGQILQVLIPAVLGLAAFGRFAAANNLFRPLNPLMQSATALLLPTTASLVSEGANREELRRRARIYLIVCAGGFALYGLILTLLAGPILTALYRGRYGDLRTVVLLFAIANVASMVVSVLSATLKATGNVRTVPFIWAGSAGIVAIFSVPAMLAFGLGGAAFVMASSYVAAALVAWRRTRILEVRL